MLQSASFGFLFIRPLIRYFDLLGKRDHYKTAGKVAVYFPQIKDDLLNAIQLVSAGIDNKMYSSGLVDASFKKVYEKTKNIQI